MIFVVSGKLGSGKSYDTVRRMLNHLYNGGCIRTNISLDWRQISEGLGRRLDSRQIGKLSATSDPTLIPRGDFRGHGRRRVMVVLDEALNWFQSEGKATNDDAKKRWGEWLRQSDKLGQDVYFIAQNFERAAKWIRELAHYSVRIIPIGDLRIFFVPLRLFGLRSFYSVRVIDLTTKTGVALEIHRRSSSVWKYYDTAETFGFRATGSAYEGLSVAPPFRLPVFPLALALLPWALAWVIRTFFG